MDWPKVSKVQPHTRVIAAQCRYATWEGGMGVVLAQAWQHGTLLELINPASSVTAVWMCLMSIRHFNPRTARNRAQAHIKELQY